MADTADNRCFICGEKVSFFNRKRLKDGSCFCADCLPHMPSYIVKNIMAYCHPYDVGRWMAYLEYSRDELEPIFQETMRFGRLRVDAVNKLFYIGGGLVAPVYYRIGSIEEFEITFQVKEFQEGFFRDNVIGNAFLELVITDPILVYADVIAEGIKTPAEKGLFSGNVRFEWPDYLQDFIDNFYALWQAERAVKIQEEEQPEEGMLEFEKAKALLMLDDVDYVDLTGEMVRAQRDRLLRLLYSDTVSGVDEREIEKINRAYQLLIEITGYPATEE